jgi:hypothetical protein
MTWAILRITPAGKAKTRAPEGSTIEKSSRLEIPSPAGRKFKKTCVSYSRKGKMGRRPLEVTAHLDTLQWRAKKKTLSKRLPRKPRKSDKISFLFERPARTASSIFPADHAINIADPRIIAPRRRESAWRMTGAILRIAPAEKTKTQSPSCLNREKSSCFEIQSLVKGRNPEAFLSQLVQGGLPAGWSPEQAMSEHTEP